MFAPCPHCGFRLALIASADAASRRCPRCHGPVGTQAQAQTAMQAEATTPAHAAAGDTRGQDAPRDATAEANALVAEGPSPPAVERSARDTDDVADPPGTPDAGTPAMHAPAMQSPAGPQPAHRPAAGASDAPHVEPTPDARPRAGDAPDTDASAPVRTEAPHAPPRPVDAAAPKTASPSFARRRRAPATARANWAWRIGASALAALLALQLLLAQRDTLAQDPRWRPVLARACDAGLCTLPAGRDASAFEMVERHVRPVAGTRELDVHARFRNAAAWPQEWPHLQLVLSDAQGRPAAARVFAPRDYAGDASRRAIAPGQTVTARLRVVEPQPATVAFAFDFR